MYVDRRRTIRAPCDLAVEWRSGRKLMQGRAKDLNADGLFVVVDQTIELNQIMDLTVTLPSGKVSLLGVSRFCGKTRQGRGIGVQIYAIDPDDQKRWTAYYRIALEEMLRRLPEPVARMLRVPPR